MKEKDFYNILGVSRSAADDEIKRAYRKLALKYHPDKHKGESEAEERFKSINEAYGILKDPEKRARYDRFGYAGMGAGVGAGAAPGDFQDLFGEVFSDFFGFGSRVRAAERGADLRYDLDISFDEAAFGSEKKIRIPTTVACASCKGSGAKGGTRPESCGVCNGSGQQMFQQGFFSISRPCSACGGKGAVIRNPCTACSGTGRKRTTRTLTVKIPAGVDTGSRLRLSGEGEAGERGGPGGDLYVVMNVAPHPIFERQDDDIICEVPISFPQAALGAEIEVPTLDKPVKLKIPAGIQSGRVFRLRHKGIASVHTGRRGDQHVVVKIETPSGLTARQRELLEEFTRISKEDTMPLRKTFFDKVKEIFG